MFGTWSDADVRNLLIGIAGGLIVLVLVALWRVTKAVGAASFAHNRRQLAKATLRLVERLDDRLSWLALACLINVLYLAALVAAGTVITLGAIVAYALRLALSPFVTGALVGASAGLLVGVSLFVLGLGFIATRAVLNRDLLIRDLRRSAGMGEPAANPSEEDRLGRSPNVDAAGVRRRH